MLTFLAIGDAYGAGFEYVSAPLVKRHNDLTAYFQHPRHRGIRPGQYTDDTQMSLAVAEALLENPRPTRLQWAQHFVSAFQRDPREGYAQRFYDFLLTLQDGQDFLARIQPHSHKSGAAMRALPVGFLADPQTVLEVSAEQARLTHDTSGGIRSAQAVALSAHYCLRRPGPLEGLANFLQPHLGDGWLDWRGSVGSAGMDSARAALTTLVRHRSLSKLLVACVDWTGDADTVAALALGIAASSSEYARDLPDFLERDLEKGAYGLVYLTDLDNRLQHRFLA